MTSRNSIYEQKMRDKGFKKITLWVPNHCEDDFKLMAKNCCDDKDQIPSCTRSIKTGKIKGINQ